MRIMSYEPKSGSGDLRQANGDIAMLVFQGFFNLRRIFVEQSLKMTAKTRHFQHIDRHQREYRGESDEDFWENKLFVTDEFAHHEKKSGIARELSITENGIGHRTNEIIVRSTSQKFLHTQLSA